jgi:hypothetical protein
MTCLIWGTPAEIMPKMGDYDHINSRRAGGEYKVIGSYRARIQKLSEPEKKRLTTWIVSQHRAGITVPVINGDVLDAVARGRDMGFSERVNAAVSFYGTESKIGGGILVDNQGAPRFDDFLALTESANAEEARSLVEMMEAMGLIKRWPNDRTQLTPDGWLRFEELQRRQVQSSQAFVAMWFNSATEEPYENGIQRAIYDSGYGPRRVDQKHHHLNKVDDEIIAEIRRSRFLVADFTCEPGKVRGGVYFEAGFAMGLNIPIIWTCKDTSIKDLHFDTRQYPHILWKDSADLYTQLKARIAALIGEGPKVHAGT